VEIRDAMQLAEAVRAVGGYRWVGIYEVRDTEIGVIGWSGPHPPAFPTLPRDRGLCGAALLAGETVIVGDVTADPRYLTTLSNTRSEMAVPIRVGGKVVGLVDVESDVPYAFTAADRDTLESHAKRIAGAWSAAATPTA
jgi:GAF domain-containing protein